MPACPLPRSCPLLHRPRARRPLPSTSFRRARTGALNAPHIAPPRSITSRYASIFRIRCPKRMRCVQSAGGIYEQEDKLGEVTDRQCHVATHIIAVPASIGTLRVKLEIFRYWWDKERNGDESATIDPRLNGVDVMDVAAGIVLDILTMIRRGDGGLAEIGKAA